ncbi:hypothetical protein BKP35_01460 [Anaerobacillus arseniciselenatis]|uniref:Uncharacterized protein n=1 Tax=Anaerobacillus arseniciselenatis TaxID=85682 RepID=A0A1S2LT47_9BACI|nr:SGNH/GDSL hydrolase family protein [Anaerobacillus arseniciselenatis]OIJ15688.1 hypothetical protein BKP35_01460 [Anaerobacillus arseniciselenatis]
MKIITSKISILVVIFTLVFSFLHVVPTEANNDSFHYVALGDSLTVGFEPQHLWDSDAKVYGFVDRVFEEALSFNAEATMSNYGVIGLTSTGLKNLLVSMDEEKSVRRSDIQPWLLDPRLRQIIGDFPAMKEDIKKANLMTITIGGNDFGARTYLDIRDLDDKQLQQFLDERIEVYRKNIETSLNIIFQLNPDVKVVITDQYNPFPHFNGEMYEKLNLLTTQFSKEVKEVVYSYQEDDFNIVLAPIADSFVHREALFTHILRADIHPNQRGYERIANVITETVWGGEEETSSYSFTRLLKNWVSNN